MLEPVRLFEGQIRYTFPALATAVGDIDTAVTTMRTELDDLDTRIRPKLINWDGGAMGSYAETKLAWDTAANNIATLLNSVSRAVGESNERMISTEMTNALRFQRG
jgi:early secretory antigenic target protein ESAT-6